MPNRRVLHLETRNNYRFYSQTTQQICKLFLGCIEKTKKIDKTGVIPTKEKIFFHSFQNFVERMWLRMAHHLIQEESMQATIGLGQIQLSAVAVSGLFGQKKCQLIQEEKYGICDTRPPASLSIFVR